MKNISRVVVDMHVTIVGVIQASSARLLHRLSISVGIWSRKRRAKVTLDGGTKDKETKSGDELRIRKEYRGRPLLK